MTLPWIATVDAFQQQVYGSHLRTAAEMTVIWSSVVDRYSGLVDWGGYDDLKSCLWHRVHQIFLRPLYFMEFGIGILGGLQVWRNWKRNKRSAMREFRNALAKGDSQPLDALFRVAGCRLDFGDENLRELVKELRRELEKLS